jgi:hypothetical protein
MARWADLDSPAFAEHRQKCKALADAWAGYFAGLPETIARNTLAEHTIVRYMRQGMRGGACELVGHLRYRCYDLDTLVAMETLIFGDSHLLKVHFWMREHHW